jgi:hypothetical protein
VKFFFTLNTHKRLFVDSAENVENAVNSEKTTFNVSRHVNALSFDQVCANVINAFSLSSKSQVIANTGDTDTQCTLDYVVIPGTEAHS